MAGAGPADRGTAAAGGATGNALAPLRCVSQQRRCRRLRCLRPRSLLPPWSLQLAGKTDVSVPAAQCLRRISRSSLARDDVSHLRQFLHGSERSRKRAGRDRVPKKYADPFLSIQISSDKLVTSTTQSHLLHFSNMNMLLKHIQTRKRGSDSPEAAAGVRCGAGAVDSAAERRLSAAQSYQSRRGWPSGRPQRHSRNSPPPSQCPPKCSPAR